MPQRRLHDKLKVPVSSVEPMPKLETTEKDVLKALAEDYIVNPGLYMTKDDLRERLVSPDDAKLEQILIALESQGLVKVYRDGRGAIALAKATYQGLRKGGSQEGYKWFPEWLSKEFTF